MSSQQSSAGPSVPKSTKVNTPIVDDYLQRPKNESPRTDSNQCPDSLNVEENIANKSANKTPRPERSVLYQVIVLGCAFVFDVGRVLSSSSVRQIVTHTINARFWLMMIIAFGVFLYREMRNRQAIRTLKQQLTKVTSLVAGLTQSLIKETNEVTDLKKAMLRQRNSFHRAREHIIKDLVKQCELAIKLEKQSIDQLDTVKILKSQLDEALEIANDVKGYNANLKEWHEYYVGVIEAFTISEEHWQRINQRSDWALTGLTHRNNKLKTQLANVEKRLKNCRDAHTILLNEKIATIGVKDSWLAHKDRLIAIKEQTLRENVAQRDRFLEDVKRSAGQVHKVLLVNQQLTANNNKQAAIATHTIEKMKRQISDQQDMISRDSTTMEALRKEVKALKEADDQMGREKDLAGVTVERDLEALRAEVTALKGENYKLRREKEWDGEDGDIDTVADDQEQPVCGDEEEEISLIEDVSEVEPEADWDDCAVLEDDTMEASQGDADKYE